MSKSRLDELNQKYTALCQQLGDLTYKRTFLMKQIDEIQKEFASLIDKKEDSNGSSESSSSGN